MISLSLLIVALCTLSTVAIVFWVFKNRDDGEESIKAFFMGFFITCLVWSAGVVSIIICLIKYFVGR